jgi:hypothetical protein
MTVGQLQSIALAAILGVGSITSLRTLIRGRAATSGPRELAGTGLAATALALIFAAARRRVPAEARLTLVTSDSPPLCSCRQR